ncbi:putative G-protein coupled receptor 45 [Oculina patagonica]
MSNNTTCFLHQPSSNESNFYSDAQSHSFDFYGASLPVLVAIAILSPVAVVGNALVLAAIWRNPSLRTPSYILLAGVGCADFCTGIITEPFFATNYLVSWVYPLIKLSEKKDWPTFYLITRGIGDGCYEYFFNLTLFIITFMSIERWLHMSRRSLVTVSRIYQATIAERKRLAFFEEEFKLFNRLAFFHFAMPAIVSYAITVATCVINAIISPVAVAGNSLILVAIYKKPSLRTPSYILLGGLAITDFFMGLLTLPASTVSTVLVESLHKGSPRLCLMTGIFVNGIGSYLGFITIFVISFMSVERWLHMSRNSTITVPRVFKAYMVICLLPIPFISARLVQSLDGCIFNKIDAIEGIVVFVCLLITTVFYFKVFQIIRRHQLQIQANQPAQAFGQTTIDFTKYKKSVVMLLYILALFAVCYLPSAVFLEVMLFYQDFQLTEQISITANVLSTLYFLSSALNPLLYCWRIRDLRISVKQLLMKIFQQDV